MQSCATIIILLAVITVHTSTPPEEDPPCVCDQCNEEAEKNTEDINENETTLELYKEDSDGDGNRTICARDRDFNDRTFPSVCHMLCFNRCLILRFSTVKINNTERYVAAIYRNNYYKLRDADVDDESLYPDDLSPIPSTSRGTFFMIIPQEITAIPTVKPRLITRGRKTESLTKITTVVYKKELLCNQKDQTSCKRKRKSSANCKTKKKLGTQLESDDSFDIDVDKGPGQLQTVMLYEFFATFNFQKTSKENCVFNVCDANCGPIIIVQILRMSFTFAITVKQYTTV